MPDNPEQEPVHITVQGPESRANPVPVHMPEIHGDTMPERTNPELSPNQGPAKYGREVLSRIPDIPENQAPPQ